MRERAAALPGVRAASLAAPVPFTGAVFRPIDVPGAPRAPGAPAVTLLVNADEHYPGTLGVRVLTVTDDGPAAKAGIEEGDRIISIDGTALRVDPADAEDPMFRDLASRRLQRTLAKHKVGDEVALVVRRRKAAPES